MTLKNHDFFDLQSAHSSVIALRRSSKAHPKAKLAPKKDRGHRLVICCLSDPLQPSESQHNHYIWEVCSANWWDVPKTATSATSTDQQKRPNSPPLQCPTAHHTTNASKVEQIGLWSFASSVIFTWSLTNWVPPLQASWQLFAGKMLPQPAAAAAKSGQSCPTLCNPIDSSPPGSSIPGILQARTLEWVASVFSIHN